VAGGIIFAVCRVIAVRNRGTGKMIFSV